MKKCLLLLCLLLTCVSGWAHDFEVDGIYYKIISKDDLAVSVTFRGNSLAGSPSDRYADSVTIPESVTYSGKTYSVISIGNSAFNGCTGLTSVTIGNSVTSIGNSAFNGCTGLTSVTIGNGVTSIDLYAFKGCTGLTSVTIPNSVTSIGGEAFFACSGLTSVTIPNSVTSIGNKAFQGCSGLTSVHITDLASWCRISFFNYLSNPLYNAHHLYLNGEEVKDLVIPNSVTSIGSSTFIGCHGLTSISISNSVKLIDSQAFSGCRGLTSISIPNSVKSIGSRAFNYCI